MPTPTRPAAHGIVVYSDSACPWAHIAVHRLHRERRRLGLDREILVDHRAFPLEMVNHQPTPKMILDAEVPICQEIRSGRPRADVFHHLDVVSGDEIPGSPTFVLPDGSSHPNPGIEMRWVDGPGSELVVERNDPEAVVDLIQRAAALSPSD